MALTQVSTDGIKDTTIATADIADDAVTADKLANSINTEIAANTAKATNATHTGDVTGSGALTIANDAVTGAKIADNAVTSDKLASNISVGELAVTGDVHFNSNTNAGKDVYWDESASELQFNDSTYATFGTGEDMLLYHNGTDNFIKNVNGAFKLLMGSEYALKATANGSVELYYDDTKKIETTSNGISVSGGCTTTFGANTTNEAACIKVGYEGSSKGQVRVYGADASTTGSLEFKVCESDGTDDHTVLIDGSGNLKVDDGNLVIGTAGKGIDFSATSDTAGVDSENLDDYEEGSWTPTVYSSSAGTFTYASGGQQGIYTKVGNIVSVNGFIQATVGGTQTGYARLGSLPFTVANTAANYAQVLINDYGNFDNYDGHVGGYVYPGQTYAVLTFSKEGNSSAITTSQWSTSTYIYFSLTYRV